MKAVRIQLLPLGRELVVDGPIELRDLLFSHGVEFPCGGRGLCKGCRIKVLEGSLPVTPDDRRKLSEPEIAAGWRLGCRAVAHADLKLELAQWEASILSDESSFEFRPQTGLGIAVDIGTTTLVAQLLDLSTGQVLAVESALNGQAIHGADLVSRIEFSITERGEAVLKTIIRKQVGDLVSLLLRRAAPQRLQNLGDVSIASGDFELRPSNFDLRNVVVVGNTVMHHLFCGISVEPLSQYPFEPLEPGLRTFRPSELDWQLPDSVQVHFLPCPGGFVGSDILAGILATRLHETPQLSALVDLGTNGEIVVGNRDRLLCASTAAGPAFEGARISMGMRAATGAISEVVIKEGKLHCHVLGNGVPRGLCGSGLVDAAAAGLELGWISSRGRLTVGEGFVLADPVTLNQRDVRELQLAKGAIAAGLHVLLEQWGARPEEVSKVYLAGAFGNYVNQASARRIGLLDFPPEKIEPSGNTALLGAKIALFTDGQDLTYVDLLSKLTPVSLKEDPRFQEIYVEHMLFPEGL